MKGEVESPPQSPPGGKAVHVNERGVRLSEVPAGRAGALQRGRSHRIGRGRG